MAIFIPQAAAERIEREEAAKRAAEYAKRYKAVENPHSLEIENLDDRREAGILFRDLLEMFHGNGGNGIVLPDCHKNRLRVRAIERLMHDLLGDDLEREIKT